MLGFLPCDGLRDRVRTTELLGDHVAGHDHGDLDVAVARLLALARFVALAGFVGVSVLARVVSTLDLGLVGVVVGEDLTLRSVAVFGVPLARHARVSGLGSLFGDGHRVGGPSILLQGCGKVRFGFPLGALFRQDVVSVLTGRLRVVGILGPDHDVNLGQRHHGGDRPGLRQIPPRFVARRHTHACWHR